MATRRELTIGGAALAASVAERSAGAATTGFSDQDFRRALSDRPHKERAVQISSQRLPLNILHLAFEAFCFHAGINSAKLVM